MNKLTRLIAGGITAMIAVGAFAVPAVAAEEGTVEADVCDALAPDIATFTDVVADGPALLAAQAGVVDDTRTTLDDSTADLSAAVLDWIRALDGVGSESETLDAFVAAAGTFGESAADWIIAVDDHADLTLETGLNEVVLDYMTGICPVV